MRTGALEALAVLALVAAAPGPSAADTASIRLWLTQLLAAYRENREPPPFQSALTPDLRRLVALNERLNHGEAGAASDADPICGCQDWYTIHIRDVHIAAMPDSRVRASVDIVNGTPTTRTFVLARTPAGWRIDDVLEHGHASYRGGIVAENARLRRGRP